MPSHYIAKFTDKLSGKRNIPSHYISKLTDKLSGKITYRHTT
jgi:hypothetical protein